MFSIVDDRGNHYASFTTLAEACAAFAQYIRNGVENLTIVDD